MGAVADFMVPSSIKKPHKTRANRKGRRARSDHGTLRTRKSLIFRSRRSHRIHTFKNRGHNLETLLFIPKT